MNNLNLNQWVLPLATAVGAFGGFPEAPAFVKQLQQYELFKYFLLFVLIWQGGAGQNVQTALILTVVLAVLLKVLN